MKTIGKIQNNFYVVQISPKKFNVEFRTNKYVIKIHNFKCDDDLSEETLAYKGDLIINNDKIGVVSNDGQGGGANIVVYKKYHSNYKEVIQELKEIENYCFPSNYDMESVMDELSALLSLIRTNDTITRVEESISMANTVADEYRKKFYFSLNK